jgi:hypothetical protein
MSNEELGIPIDGNDKRKSERFLPRFFRSDSNKKFLSGTVDNLIQNGTVRRLNGYIGRKNSKSTIASDVFLEDPLKDRLDYQLEPSIVSEDNLGNVTFFKDYLDYINTINVLGGNTSNHQKLNIQEVYSWNPHIDWDKIVNYLQYYWLPFGPETIPISGTKVLNTNSTFTVTTVDEGDNFAYLFTPNGLTRNPVLRLYRGETYQFEINSPSEPFSIKNERVSGKEFKYLNGVDNSSVTQGIITFTVPIDAPEVLYYVSENNVDTSGIIKIFDIAENTQINVVEELIGKRNFSLPNGISLSNGMKVRFRGKVTPIEYENEEFYVEGVGEAIQLVNIKDLEIPGEYTQYVDIDFDMSGFDENVFNNANYAVLEKDYITVNRSSRDRNPWSRANRWIHQDVITKTAEILGNQPVFNQDSRAIRPIIEFKPNIRLYNFGSVSRRNIDLVDDFTTDAFSIVEGALGYYVDGVELVNGHRIIFNADNDILVKNKIYRVEFVNLFDETTTIKTRRIHLVEEDDSDPTLDECLLVLSGNKYTGKMFWFNGSDWVFGQEKTKLNQPPLFDLYDEQGISLSDITKYEATTFIGNKIFSYSQGTGKSDSELGFSLNYKNINNIGDILFDFNLTNESFTYKINDEIIKEKTDNKFLKKYSIVGDETLVNGWTICAVSNLQPIVRIYKGDSLTNFTYGSSFNIDVYDDIEELNDLIVKVYVNGKRLDPDLYVIDPGLEYYKVTILTSIDNNSIITFRCYSKQNKNQNGHYEFPINFQNNPENNNIKNFTLGEVIDHVDSIVDNIYLDNFKGVFPGANNLRDLPRLSSFGTKFVQHSGSINLSLYHLTNKNCNIIQALDKARDDYGKFKRSFVYSLKSLEDNILPKDAVDIVLLNLSQGKTKQSPYYFSDMLGYGASNKFKLIVKDPEIKKYPLAKNFSLDTLTPVSLNIYLNDIQLLHQRDYTFTNDGFVNITVEKNENDILTFYEYEKTDGCFIPPTPTSLGLYPKFEPRKYLDSTLIEPRNVIQGHDGSIILAFDDYRDDLILELEKRFFNNIKCEYDPKIFDIYDYIPGSNRQTTYNIKEFNQILAPNFFKWRTLIDTDYSKSLLFLSNNPFTYNYSEAASLDNMELAGFWRGIYKWYFDTDRIHICPWESLGFSIKPKWWDDVYGPAPYTKNNLILWNDLRDGVIREPNRPIIKNLKFAKPILENIPVDEEGKLLDPISSNLATGLFNSRIEKNYIFGDQGPVETAWRRSSYYAFSLIKTILLMHPNKTFATLFDRSRIVKNKSNQLVYSTTGLRINLKDILTTSVSVDSSRVQTSGLINYIIDYLISDNLKSINDYRYDLKNITNKLSHRLGGFTSKDKFNLILDSKSASATSGVFIPKENYKIFLNSSSPTKKLFYSGVIITKILTRSGLNYEIKGYSQTQPYFYYYDWNKSGININVGGISESYINWESNQRYIAGNILKINNNYYRVKTSHTSSTSVSFDLLQRLSELPIIGGVDVNLRAEFIKTPLILNYGSFLKTEQEVVDFLQGYSEYLKDQGFEFDEFNSSLQTVTNWDTSVREFLFWTTQNWSSGADQYKEWETYTKYSNNQVVFYEGEFYRSIKDHETLNFFDINNYTPLEKLNSDGAAVISLSPAALKINLKLNYNVVDDLRETHNIYEIFAADGSKYDPQNLYFVRYDNKFSLYPRNDLGIYGAAIYLVQKEHVLIIDNTSQFNDVIFNLETGYRQEKIKIAGYKTINWNGSFDAPGFIYDQAIIKEWTPWTDYSLGDIVKYKEFYYTANQTIIGSENFETTDWIRTDEKPQSRLLPNWDYKSLQFTDFYDLDSDNFDVGQQRVAQHLIGYQKRQYLENIIKNDVSEFKFYQGMITEKGTHNSLNKLFDVLSASEQDSIDFIEEWAIRVGEYGASDAFEEIEFILDEAQFKIEPQAFELVNTVNNSLTDYIIRQTKNDVYLKPKQYSNDIWPINNNYRPFLKTPGFVRLDQVVYALDKKDDILNIDINILENGSYIWCAFESKINQFGDDWFIYRVNHLDLNIKNVVKSNNNLVIEFNINPRLTVGDIIGFKSTENFNLIGKVSQINDKSITMVSPTVGSLQLVNINMSIIKTYKFADYRFENIDQLIVPKYLNPVKENWSYGEIVWFNNNKNQVIWQNLPVYSQNSLSDSILVNNSNFGHKVCINKSSNLLLVSSNNQVRIYRKFNQSSWIKSQVLEDLTVTNFGKSLAISEDDSLIAIGCNISNNNGAVKIYKVDLANSDFSIRQTITNPEEISLNVPIQDQFFGYKLKFSKDDNNISLFISSTNGVSISGKIYIYDSDTVSINDSQIYYPFSIFNRLEPIDCDEEPFAYDYDVNKNGSILVLSACLNDGGKVYVHERKIDGFKRQQIINMPGTEERFGFAMALNDTGELLAVSSTYGTVDFKNQGRVRIYKTANALDDSTVPSINYSLDQIIDNRNAEADEELGEQYGYFLKFANDNKTLVIFSKYGNASTDPIIGEDSTKIVIDSGRIDVYDKYLTKYIFSESLTVPNSTEGYGSGFDIGDNNIVVGAPNAINQTTQSGKVYIYTKRNNEFSWRLYLEEQPKIDIDVFKKIFLYNKKTSTLISYVDIIDPVQGKIAGVAEEEIKYKTYYDPAIYNFKQANTTLKVNVDDGMNWIDLQVGTLWWDLRRAKFLDSTMGNTTFRNFTWNSLYPTGSIDLYEWVVSKFTPEQWDQLTGTQEGFSRGISGKTLYGNKVYSIKKVYDSLSDSFSNLYYFWVKDKTTIPSVNGRTTSAIDIIGQIQNPKNYNLRSIQFLSPNSFSLSNVSNILVDKDVVLSIQYWTVPEKEKLIIHNEWKIISENEKSEIPPEIEKKWVDSLIGIDRNGYFVPDTTLSPKQRYGVEFKPRQSMFINRIEALKQVIERFNKEIKDVQIDNLDLSDLIRKDELPSTVSGQYDVIIDTEEELRFISAESYKQAFATPIINNGRIIDLEFTSRGIGYAYPPVIKIVGSGKDAEIKSIINSNGVITDINIVNPGKGYDISSTVITIRPLTALVRSNEFGYWTLHSYNTNSRTWTKIKTQEYDVTRFWDYIDWYAQGYNQFTKVDYIVDGIYQVFNLSVKIGQIVKVNNLGSDWLLLEKYSNEVSIDYTKTYKVVGRQNGSLQLSTKFYNFTTSRLGFDGSLYDTNIYDGIGSIELRIILESFKTKLLVDDRRKIYLNLFFVSIRYVLSEQPFVDWVFKTSFIKALHNVGSLKQKINYNNDSLQDFENYIKEVKPYRSKIREFTSIYSNIEDSQSIVSDFDLPSYIENFQIKSLGTSFVENMVTVDNLELLQQQPWTYWYENIGFEIKEVVISDPGNSYLMIPKIEFEGICTRPAKAKAFIVGGKLEKIQILDPGKGYFVQPKVIINSNVDKNGRIAVAHAVLGNSAVRSNIISMKFDRYLKEKMDDISLITVEDTFQGNGSMIDFYLRYKPSLESNSIIVTINDQESIVGSYYITPLTKNTKGYTEHYAKLTFVDAPPAGSDIKILYQKDFVHLNALERIYHYYDPGSGMIGRDFSQLMVGIDYGGVNVVGIGFEKPHTWDGGIYGWGERSWDETVPTDNELYDTIIDGGNLESVSAYRTASGLKADDIIIDGDGFITPNTSPAPEEMLPGHVVDSVAITVFERALTSSSDIISNNYLTDGVTDSFKISKYPNNKNAIIVKLDTHILKPDVDYIFNYDLLTVTLNQIPEQGKIVSITGLGFNGENLLITDVVTITNITTEVLTNLDWQEDTVAYTLVSGNPVNNELFRTQGNNVLENKIGIRFPFELEPGQVVNYSIFLGTVLNQSLVSRETLISNGSNKKYYLNNPVGKKVPLDPNTIVRVGDTILNSIDSFRYSLTDQILEYEIPAGKADIDRYSINDYLIYINGTEVELGVGYTLDLLNSKLLIKTNYYSDDAEVIVTITKDADYFIKKDVDGTYIEFRNVWPAGTEIEIVSMFNHDILEIERKYYIIEPKLNNFINSVYYLNLIQISAGIFSFDREVLDASYVWLTKNKKLLTPNIDYILLNDRKSVRISGQPTSADKFSIITFSGNVVRNPVSFMKFKDMLNRFHYKRLSKNRTTRLENDLSYSDKEIFVENPGRINPAPGVVYINGERIEYYFKVGNRLGQLRRGTYGTGVPTVHRKFTEVYDIGDSESVPYQDEEVIYRISDIDFSDSTKTITIPFVANKDNIEVFIGTRRLRKNQYTTHNKDVHPESPEGDQIQPAEFTADGVNRGTETNRISYIVLNQLPPPNVPITVSLKKFTLWGDKDKSLSESDNRIAYFLKYNVEEIIGTGLSTDSGLYTTDSDDVSMDEE